MEQGQCYWMHTKRKYSLSSNSLASSSLSWEEQAFAEDAAGSLVGGCTWPPRSYSCSFCRREFRSAQALGGHMNVHRKDRARLKQPSSPQNNEILFPHDLETHQTPFSAPSLGNYLAPYPPPVYDLAYKTNPNPDHNFLASTSSPSPNSKPLLSPSINNSSSILHKISPLNSSGDRLYSQKYDIEEVSKGMDARCMNEVSNEDDIDVAMSLNLVVCRAQLTPVQFESIQEAEDRNCKKRKRIDASSSNDLFFQKSRSVDDRHVHHMQPKVFEFSPINIEELDLELRLGN